MNNNSVAQAGAFPPILEGLKSSVFNYLNAQESLITQIENKLHLILDRGQSPTRNESEERVSSDFSAKISVEINKLTSNNNRLEGILNHLSEII